MVQTINMHSYYRKPHNIEVMKFQNLITAAQIPYHSDLKQNLRD